VSLRELVLSNPKYKISVSALHTLLITESCIGHLGSSFTLFASQMKGRNSASEWMLSISYTSYHFRVNI
jgi:hypothetical protein